MRRCFLCLLSFVSLLQACQASESLRLALTVFRGGARSPLNWLPGVRQVFDDSRALFVPPDGSAGRISNVGVTTLETLGSKLAARYLEAGLISDTYSAGVVRMRATDNMWSQLSAQSVLNGIFPFSHAADYNNPRSFAVHVNVDAEDLLLLAPRHCPAYQFLKQDVLFSENNKDYSKLKEKAHPLLAAFHRAFSMPLDQVNFTNWDAYVDTFECFIGNDIDSIGHLTRQQMEATLILGGQLEYLAYPREYAGLVGGNLVEHILTLMKKTIQTSKDVAWYKRPPRWHLFSGHKETISSLMVMLGLQIERVPAFSSVISLELYENTNSGRWNVKVLRGNGEPDVPMTYMTVCNETLVDNGCSFNSFSASMEAQIKEDWGLSCLTGKSSVTCIDPFGAASNETDYIDIESPVSGLWYILSLLSTLIILGVAVLVFWKWKRGPLPEEIGIQMSAQKRPKKRFTLE